MHGNRVCRCLSWVFRKVKDTYGGSAITSLACFYIIKTIMETRKTRSKTSSDAYRKMLRNVRDAKKGLISFDQLREAWLVWAKDAIEELGNQAAQLEKPVPQKPEPTDSTV